jgi:proline iminopeptidase
MYPPLDPYQTIMLHTDTLSNGEMVKIYVECSGNPHGYPIIYCHGGPGDHVTSRLRQLYNPNYKIILFDQRGCGHSKPLNHLEKNTTSFLLSDMEAIRKHIGCDQWIVSGGSWGSSLALLYAEQYPTRVSGLILRGIYDLSTTNDILDIVYPEKEKQMSKLLHLKTKSNKEMYTKTTRLLNSKKTKKRRKLIELLADDESMYVISKQPHEDTFQSKETLSIVGNHYEKNKYFVAKNKIYKNIHKIKHIPTIMVEGRYDLVTPMKMAYKLSKKLNHCELMIVRGGHSSQEHEVTRALVHASDKMYHIVNSE